jgi:hypothetical protein
LGSPRLASLSLTFFSWKQYWRTRIVSPAIVTSCSSATFSKAAGEAGGSSSNMEPKEMGASISRSSGMAAEGEEEQGSRSRSRAGRGSGRTGRRNEEGGARGAGRG